MAGMGMGGDGAGRGARRRAGDYFAEPATRPPHVTDKTGATGIPIPLISNHFKLEMAPDYTLYQYHVTFSPEIANRNLRYRIVKDHKVLLGEPRAFDGMQLFLPRRLEQKVTEVFSTLPSDGSTIGVTFTLTAELPAGSPICLQMYNIIFRRILKILDLQLVGRYYYNPEAKITIPQHKFEVWPGYITSILKKESSVMLMADISHRILRMNTVLDIMYDLYNQARRNFHDECTKKLVGEIVLTRYNNKTYRVDDIDWNQNPASKFKLRDESEISYADYYKKQHNITVQDAEQPLIMSRPKKRDIRAGQDGPIFLLPELCTLTGLSDEVRQDFRVMKDIATHTRVAPEQRYNALKKFVDQMNTHPEVVKEVTGWNLKFEKDLLKMQGRILPPEKILQAGNSSYGYKPEDAEWSREMRGQKLISCVALQNWCIIFTNRDQPKAQDFLQTISRVGPPMGIQINKPAMLQLPDDQTQSYLSTLKDNVTPQTQMACCILPTNRKDRYDAIKKFCCVEHPVPSQVVLGRTLAKKQMLMSVCTKIAIQLNCKLGGEVWGVEIPLKNTMVIGIDTYHDSAKKGRSVGAFIASMNRSMTRYYSRVTFQTNMQELQDGMRVCMQASLRKYHEVNGSLPDMVILFRDGVGDGQLGTVAEHEVPQLLGCFKEVGGDYNPRTAVIVVKKRINERFFARKGQLTNPPPGTIIDNEVTRPEWYDYFLISQSVRQGTVTPSHYNVIWDTTGLKPDHIQRLTYKLCHLYYNWPGTIRVPAPCQYAHKLAFLVGQSLHKDPHLALSDKLFFL